MIQKLLLILDSHLHQSFVLLSLNQERKLCLAGKGKSRLFVQFFKGPGPFEICSSLAHGFNTGRASLVLNLYADGVDAQFAYPFIATLSKKGVFLSCSTIICRCRMSCSCNGIFTGQTSVHAAHKDEA